MPLCSTVFERIPDPAKNSTNTDCFMVEVDSAARVEGSVGCARPASGGLGDLVGDSDGPPTVGSLVHPHLLALTFGVLTLFLSAARAESMPSFPLPFPLF